MMMQSYAILPHADDTYSFFFLSRPCRTREQSSRAKFKGKHTLRERASEELCVPGMMYVKLRSALSICDTCPAFLVIKSSYMLSHWGGRAKIWPSVGRDGRAALGLDMTDGEGMAGEGGDEACSSRRRGLVEKGL